MLPVVFGHMLLAVLILLLALTTINNNNNLVLATSNMLPIPLNEVKECTSIDIRNECSELHLLDNCTVIVGYMMITLMPNNSKCNYSDYQFPKLREITDFVIFTAVRGLVNIRNMFPNLIVIRGRRLFLNYALGVTSMADLEMLEFKSLVAIQHGHVYIGNCHKLCQLNRINWDRLTLSAGENHIVVGSNNCTDLATCKGCTSSYCWSNFTCQRFENDDVAHYDKNSQSCHEECLGGCYNTTAAGCVVCRGLTDDGVCVKHCPDNKYLLEQYQRCYTRDMCVAHHGHYTFNSACVAFCPSGYRANNESDCIRCDAGEPCVSVCSPEHNEGVMIIYNLDDAEELRGCQIVNSSLVITIRNEVNEEQLERSLSSIREIRGHLKIFRSSHLSSLKFLRNLQRIHGDPLENRLYALILYDNKKLSELWEPTERLEFIGGGMFMHRNNELCNKHMKDFQARVIHDKTLDSLQTSDQEVMCGPSKLQLTIEVRNHRTLHFSWPKSQTSEEVELIYRPVPADKQYVESSELEAPICTRINWQRLLLFVNELEENDTNYTYELKQLEPHTRYACLLRTFGGDVQHEARSDLIYVQTQLDIPKTPTLSVTKKTDNTLTLLLGGGQWHDYFLLTVSEILDDAAYIDERDYCRQPAYLFQDMDEMSWRLVQDYDYDSCCLHKEELAVDQRFIKEMKHMYRCTMDTPGNCAMPELEHSYQLNLKANSTGYELQHLERYRSYSLQLQACNTLGCSSSAMVNERTNYTSNADLLPELSACRVPKSTQYMMKFAEPTQPNALIVNYVLHYRNNVSDQLADSHLSCITRRAHAKENYIHVSTLNGTFNECAVRVHSLAGDIITPYVPITWCDSEQSKLAASATKEDHIDDATEMTEDTQLHGHGVSIFLLFFLFGCSVSMVWFMYKRRCWRKLPGLRRYVPVREQWLRERIQTEDREILVDGFETVRFQNNSNNNNHNNDDY